jgi:hypothetical protein
MLTACGAVDSAPQEPLEITSQPLSSSNYGFARSDQLTGTFTPDPSHAVATGLGAITIQNLATGQYQVSFGNLGGQGGNAQVVAYGTDNARCKIESFWQSGSSELLYVLCHTPAGSLVNSKFIVRYGRSLSSLPSAYLLADQPSAASYTPGLTYNFNSTGVANTVTRSAVGTYTVNLPGLGGANGNVLVTALGSGSAHCNVASWSSGAGTRPIVVRCWSDTGVPADSMFSLAFDGVGITGFRDVGGFAWANDPASALYTPNTSYSYSMAHRCDGGSHTAGKLSTGRYFMRHTRLPWIESTVHVTARNEAGAADYCKIEGWDQLDDGVEVTTRCFDASGTSKDSEYLESYYTTDFKGPC